MKVEKVKQAINNVFDNLPSYYKVQNLRYHQVDYTRLIHICIYSVAGGGARIESKFINGTKFTALVFNNKHYKQCINQIRYMVIDSFNNLIK